MIAEYGEEMRQFVAEVIEEEREFITPTGVAAVLTCEQDPRLKVVLVDGVDDDQGPVRLQLWNTPRNYWRWLALDPEVADDYFAIFDETAGFDDLRVCLPKDGAVIGFEISGVNVTWRIDRPRRGDDWSDLRFQKRFCQLVEDVSPVSTRSLGY